MLLLLATCSAVLKKSDNYQAFKYSRTGRVLYNLLPRGFSRGKGSRVSDQLQRWPFLVAGLFRRSKGGGMDIIPTAVLAKRG
jgi:hypothetical protein